MGKSEEFLLRCSCSRLLDPSIDCTSSYTTFNCNANGPKQSRFEKNHKRFPKLNVLERNAILHLFARWHLKHFLKIVCMYRIRPN